MSAAGVSITYGSVCSGIEAASAAWKPLGWECAFLSEIEAFPRAVLKHHYPETPLHGDFTTIRAGEYRPIDVLVGGTPCQSFSVAGLRGGLDDDRGNLALEYLRLADRLRPRWLLWENVPGVLSSNEGRDFGAILGGMVELGYGFAYRVLDAQFFGVAQRRRRVFVVGRLGDWRRAAAVLFERHSLQGHPAPRRATREGTAYSPGFRAAGDRLDAGRAEDRGAGAEAFGGGANCNPTDVSTAISAHPGGRYDLEVETFLVAPPLTHNPYGDHESREGLLVASTLTGGARSAGGYSHDDIPLVAGTLNANGKAAGSATQQDAETGMLIAFSSKDHGGDAEVDLSPTLRAGAFDTSHANSGVPPAIAFALRGREGGAMPEVGGDQIGALRAASGGSSRDYVAFDRAQITSATNRSQPKPGDPAPPLHTFGEAPCIAGSAVRRLTPRECERLQGFPEIENTLRIIVCRSEDEKRARARSAEGSSVLPVPDQDAPVAVHVLIDLERQALQLHSLGRSPWSASIAELASSSRLSMPADAFARLIALTNAAVESSTRVGRAASPANTQLSSAGLNGSASVLLCGPEIAALASDAEQFTAALNQCSRSTTSPPGQSDQTCASTLETLACCVAAAMTGFIPEVMRSGCCYELKLTAHQGYTHIPWRKGTASDGPRYKALGNSMAVPVMRWLGERIAAVDLIGSSACEAAA